MLSDKALKKRFESAAKKHKSGLISEARQEFSQILRLAPNNAPARFQLASIDYAMGDPFAAAKNIEKVRRHAADKPAVWELSILSVGATDQMEWIDTLAKELDRAPLQPPAKAALKRLMGSDRPANFGNAPRSEVETLIRLLVDGGVEDALRLSRELCRKNPNAAHLINMRATAESRAGHVDIANTLFNRAILLDPYSSPIRLSFGNHLMEIKEYAQALRHLKRADDLTPDIPEILRARCEALLLDARLFTRRPEALEFAARAAQISPDNPEYKLLLARALADQDRFDEAREFFKDVLKHEDTKKRAVIYFGQMELMCGNLEEAQALLEAGVRDNPEALEAYFILTFARKVPLGDPSIETMKNMAERDDMTDLQKAPVLFALAKALADTKQHDQVFPYLRRANDAMLGAYPFDASEVEARFDRIRRIAETCDLQRLARNNSRSDDPILITGMPRSGTTLTERLFDSHSKVRAVGEVVWATSAFASLTGQEGSHLDDPSRIEAALIEAGAAYSTDARRLVPEPFRAADKTVLNHEIMGLLQAAMPKARTIVLRRDPRDTILSIYKNRFQPNSVRFNTSLRNAAFYYSIFLKYLDFWKDVMPESFIELDYDRLTDTPEAELKAAFKFADLPWENGILDFHSGEGAVRTLSATQVRQPIYKTSVRSWERYANDLQPLMDALEEFGVELPD